MNYVLPLFAAVVLLGAAPAFNSQSYAGTWKCMDSSSARKGVVNYTDTATAYGKFVKFAGLYPAVNGQPADNFENFLGYDGKLHQWVFLNVGSAGDYGIGKSTSSGMSQMSWVDGFPVDPNDGPTIVSISSSRIVADGSSTQKGKKVTTHTVCVKR